MGTTEETSAQDFDSMFASNVRAPYLLVGVFAPAMAGHGQPGFAIEDGQFQPLRSGNG